MTTVAQDSLAPYLSSIPELTDELRAGRMIILIDDEDRENEGDLVLATEFVNSDSIQFMLEHGRGLVCVTVDSQKAQQLGLESQVRQNNSSFRTPFSFSIDHKSVAGAGMSADSRALTMLRMLDEDAVADDFVSPGCVFPLVANEKGVLGRTGQTEGSLDLARLAGLQSSGIICEILDSDGAVLRGPALVNFAQTHNLRLGTVASIIEYRLEKEVFVREVASAVRNTDFGEFRMHVFEDDVTEKEHLALVYGDVSREASMLCRVHSECLTGDVLGSERCDCGGQLSAALEAIKANGSGVLLYLRQEGRGIGLLNKLRAYELQDGGVDTVDANLSLGFKADERDFRIAAQMLKVLGISSVRLMTNNPQKAAVIEASGIVVHERLPSLTATNEHNSQYLKTKAAKLGHLFTTDGVPS